MPHDELQWGEANSAVQRAKSHQIRYETLTKASLCSVESSFVKDKSSDLSPRLRGAITQKVMLGRLKDLPGHSGGIEGVPAQPRLGDFKRQERLDFSLSKLEHLYEPISYASSRN